MQRVMSCFVRVALFGLAAVTAASLVAGPASADDHHHWRERHWEHHPDVYYSAPPAVYPPYGYYARSGVSLNLNFPFR